MTVKPLKPHSLAHRQAGMTTLGMFVLVSFIGLFAFAGIRLTPIYLNYMKIVGVIDGIEKEFDGSNASVMEIRQSITRRFDIESVGEIDGKDVKVSKVDGGYEVAATYSHKTPFIANVNFVVDFDKRVTVRR